jgi:omega-amidase
MPTRIRYEGIRPWHMYVQVRALENRIPIAAPNVCNDNNDNSDNIYKGKSIFVDFDYHDTTDITVPKLRLGSSKADQVIITDVDLNNTRKLHKKRFEDFRSNLYYQL